MLLYFSAGYCLGKSGVDYYFKINVDLKIDITNVQGIVKLYCEHQVNFGYWAILTQNLNKTELFGG